MNRFVLGTGACGFLKINHILNKNGVSVVYKSNKCKYQNSSETLNTNTLLWNESNLEKTNNFLESFSEQVHISHYVLPHVDNILSLDPSSIFVCLMGDKEKCVNDMFNHFSYRNPMVSVKNNSRRCIKEQYPKYDSDDSKETLNLFWDEYYTMAKELEKKYPSQFKIVSSEKLFVEMEYQKIVFNFLNLNVECCNIPMSSENNLTTTLHGGLGNNLFQMAESVAHCDKYGLQKPVFSTWDVDSFPKFYNSDRFIGGHVGTLEELKDTFPKLQWVENKPNFDTKFMINDMFCFADVHEQREAIMDYFSFNPTKIEQLTEKYKHIFDQKPISLHLRMCSLPADDHVNGFIDESFYEKTFKNFDDNTTFMVFTDNKEKVRDKIEMWEKKYVYNFIIIDECVFNTLILMSLCEQHILHVSTLSFWGAYLDKKQPDKKTFYSKSFIECHTNNMIPYDEWICID